MGGDYTIEYRCQIIILHTWKLFNVINQITPINLIKKDNPVSGISKLNALSISNSKDSITHGLHHILYIYPQWLFNEAGETSTYKDEHLYNNWFVSRDFHFIISFSNIT